MAMSVSKQKHTNRGYIRIPATASCAVFLPVFPDLPTRRTRLAPGVPRLSRVMDVLLAFILLIPFPFHPALSARQGLTYPAQDAPDTFTR